MTAWNPLLAHRALGWLGPDVGAPARLVASRLVSHADPEGRSHPSIARLAHETGLSDRTVQRALGQLRAVGLVTWLSAFDPATGRHGANRYRVSMAALLALEAAERRRRAAGWCQPDTGGAEQAPGGGVGVANDQLRDLLTTKEAEARERASAPMLSRPPPEGGAWTDGGARTEGARRALLDASAEPKPRAPAATERRTGPRATEPTRNDAEPSPGPACANAGATLSAPGGVALETVRGAWRAAHGARYGHASPPTGAGDDALLLELLARAGGELVRRGLGRSDPGAAARVVGRVLRAYVREDGSREAYREGFLTQKRHALAFLARERKIDDFFASALGAEERAEQADRRTRTRFELATQGRHAPPSGDLWREAIERLHTAAAGPPIARPRRASGAR